MERQPKVGIFSNVTKREKEWKLYASMRLRCQNRPICVYSIGGFVVSYQLLCVQQLKKAVWYFNSLCTTVRTLRKTQKTITLKCALGTKRNELFFMWFFSTSSSFFNKQFSVWTAYNTVKITQFFVQAYAHTYTCTGCAYSEEIPKQRKQILPSTHTLKMAGVENSKRSTMQQQQQQQWQQHAGKQANSHTQTHTQISSP